MPISVDKLTTAASAPRTQQGSALNRLRPFLLLAGIVAATPAEATNYLVILLDDLGADKVSGYADIMYPGYSPVYLPETPAMDTLAEVGLRFSHAYVSPVCSPTRAALLTGQYPFETDMGRALTSTTPGHELDSSTTTIPEMLTAETIDAPTSGLFGKWHLGLGDPGPVAWTTEGERTAIPAPGVHGFSAYIGGLTGEPDDYYAWLETSWPEPLSGGGLGAVNRVRTAWAGDAPITDTVAWVSNQSGGWFAMVALNAPHDDGTGNEWEVDDLAPEDDGSCVEMNGDSTCSNKEIFASLVMDADARIEELLESLQAEDPAFLADTLILVLGDNGSQANVLESPWIPGGERVSGGKATVYESGIRAPFIVARGCDWMDNADGSFDGLLDGVDDACADATVELTTPGLTISAPIQVQDVYATIAELSGATGPVPEASVSLVPCLTATEATAGDCDSSALSARAIYTETFVRPYTLDSALGTIGPADSGSATVIMGSYKVIANVNTSGTSPCMRYEFYDHSTDPFETNDLRVGSRALTPVQSAGYLSAWMYLRTTIAPDWFASRACGTDSPWDTDHDGYEDASYGGTDCDDHDATVKPGAVDTWYDGIDRNCDGLDDFDQDLDGVPTPTGGGADCNDGDAAIGPGIPESCDGLDDNCDGNIDEGVAFIYYVDHDGDGFGASDSRVEACEMPSGYVPSDGDCDDTREAARPHATEVCNGLDDNCDGIIDEGVLLTFYQDADGDGYGKGGVSTTGCTAPAGYSALNGDCNDARGQIRPGAPEVWYDGKDMDCAGDDDYDRDHDGYRHWRYGGDDCDDDAPAVHPGAEEHRRDGRDEDCNRCDDD